MRIPSRFGMMLAVGLAGCGGGDDTKAQKLAGEVVECKSEVSKLKEELAVAKAQLAKALAANPAIQLEPLVLNGTAGKTDAPPQKEGHVNPDLVIKIFKQNVGGLKACYNNALKRKPDLQYVNEVKARFAIKGTGSAANIAFSPRTDAEMERCMAGAISSWKFPQFDGAPVAFEYPVQLVAGK